MLANVRWDLDNMDVIGGLCPISTSCFIVLRLESPIKWFPRIFQAFFGFQDAGVLFFECHNFLVLHCFTKWVFPKIVVPQNGWFIR